MKPEHNAKEEEEAENPTAIAGDVIGDTAYSERFVLKILLKLANLDSLKDEIKEKSFEDDLCTLWDMTAEHDVVLFLQKHDVLNLLNFALPVIQIPRIIEIIIGIVGNMCCHKEIVSAILKMGTFASNLLEYLKTDDSLILVQLLRLISSCLFVADDNEILQYWMDLLIKTKYPDALCFMLKNSSNKELLVTALENFNTLCSYCNVETTRTEFFTHFVTVEALESLITAFTEVTVTQRDTCQNDEELERMLAISLQIVLNLVGFEKSHEIYCNNKESVTDLINVVLSHNENKFVNQKDVDTDLVDIIDSIDTIVNTLELSNCDIDKYFSQSHSMWTVLYTITKPDKNCSTFEDDDKKDLNKFTEEIRPPLSMLMGNYLANCTDNNLLKALDMIGNNYDDIVSFIKDEHLLNAVSKRTEDYRSRLKEADS